MRIKKAIAPLTPNQVLMEQINALDKRLRVVERPKFSSLTTVSDTININDPKQGLFAINATTGLIQYYHDNEWRDILGYAKHEIKLTDDAVENAVMPARFKFGIDLDMDGFSLLTATAYNTTAGPGVTRLHVRNNTTGLPMLSTKITIDSGELDSLNATTPSVVVNPIVSAADQVYIDIEAIGTGSMGLGIRLLWALLAEVV